jgi:hypothetical protein
VDSIVRKYLSPRLLMPNRRAFPPLECCFVKDNARLQRGEDLRDGIAPQRLSQHDLLRNQLTVNGSRPILLISMA